MAVELEFGLSTVLQSKDRIVTEKMPYKWSLIQSGVVIDVVHQYSLNARQVSFVS